MKLIIKARAKINLGLDVLRKRPDGYHDLRMIMQSVNLYDVITLEAAAGGIRVTSNHSDVPNDETNLAYKAANLIKNEYKIPEGVIINIEKNIPVAAGMAGGSTDAAGVIMGMNALFSLNKDESELMRLGLNIGADVPFCIFGGTALSEGIGEVLKRIDGIPSCKVLIAKPPVNVSTKYVYENLHVDTIKRHPDIDSLTIAIKEGDLHKMADGMENILENVTAVKYPVIDELKSFMKNNGALNSIMSGSGPSVFGIYDDEAAALSAYDKLKSLKLTNEIYVTDFSETGISIGGLI